PDTKSSEQVEEKGACCSEHDELAAGEVSEDSIYQLDATWKDDTGSERKLKSLGGKIQVITMGYSTCKFACPKLLADMRAIEAGLPKAVRSKIHFTFVSIDPETDTPARLSEYRKENKINASRWTLLTGETSSVQELAVVLGIQYRKTTGTDFAHSNLISVLNAQGEVIHRQEGLTADPAATIQAIIQASK
ncbi:MAG: SCO family protein, partial [Akkermansiaceae bacterium]